MKRFVLYLLFFYSCSNQPAVEQTRLMTVASTDLSLKFEHGLCLYGAKKFSGSVTEKLSDGKVHQVINYINGRQEGLQQLYFNDGMIAESRYFKDGEKDSTHTGWWENGKLRFEYHFKKGLYHGDFKEWYEDGNPLKHIHYTNGNDDWGKGWRNNGKVYMNYIVKDGRRYGIINSNLCYSVANETIK